MENQSGRGREVQVSIERRPDIPGGLPAVWAGEPTEVGRSVRLFLRDDISDELADHFHQMCHADALSVLDGAAGEGVSQEAQPV